MPYGHQSIHNYSAKGAKSSNCRSCLDAQIQMATTVVRLHSVWSAARCCVLKAIVAKRTWEVTKWALVLHMRRSVVQEWACFYACVNVRYCWWPIRTKDVFTYLLIWMRTARQIRDWGNVAYLFSAQSLNILTQQGGKRINFQRKPCTSCRRRKLGAKGNDLASI